MASRVNDLKAERADKIARAREILDKAQNEKRGLLASEQRESDALTLSISDLDATISSEEAREEAERKRAERLLVRSDGSVRADESFLSNEQRMTDWLGSRGAIADEDRDLSFGRYVRGVVTGDWTDAERERRAMAEGTLSAGGYAVPTPLAAGIIDRARALARVFQAGARTVPMESQTLSLARLTGDPTASWVAENGAITASDATLDQVKFSAFTLVSLVRASRQLIEDSQNISDALDNAFAQIIALEIDRVALRGAGTTEPLGVLGTTGVQSVSMGTNGGTLTSWDKVNNAYRLVRDANFEPNGSMILAPRTVESIDNMKDTTNQPLRRPPSLENATLLSTTQVPVTDTQGTATNASAIYLGDWSQVVVGVRSQLSITLQERYSDNFQLGFMVAWRGDVQLFHPEGLAVVKGIIP